MNPLFHVRRSFGKYINQLYALDLMDSDWDNLILLDGCRYDDFKELNTLEGKLESKRSKGSSSTEFLNNNFVNESFKDTVYVTANPHVSRLLTNTFHEIRHVWQTGWNSVLGTVLPEKVTIAARQAAEEFPNKRLIIHYMQPHHPFIGRRGRRLSSSLTGNEHSKNLAEQGDTGTDHTTIWQLVRSDQVSVFEAREAYKENIKIVINSVEQLWESLFGKSVISADHGNLFHEKPFEYSIMGRKMSSHPSYCTSRKLVRVPWLVSSHSARKEIRADDSIQDSSSPGDDISERLQALGYKQ